MRSWIASLTRRISHQLDIPRFGTSPFVFSYTFHKLRVDSNIPTRSHTHLPDLRNNRLQHISNRNNCPSPPPHPPPPDNVVHHTPSALPARALALHIPLPPLLNGLARIRALLAPRGASEQPHALPASGPLLHLPRHVGDVAGEQAQRGREEPARF